MATVYSFWPVTERGALGARLEPIYRHTLRHTQAATTRAELTTGSRQCKLCYKEQGACGWRGEAISGEYA